MSPVLSHQERSTPDRLARSAPPATPAAKPRRRTGESQSGIGLGQGRQVRLGRHRHRSESLARDVSSPGDDAPRECAGAPLVLCSNGKASGTHLLTGSG